EGGDDEKLRTVDRSKRFDLLLSLQRSKDVRRRLAGCAWLPPGAPNFTNLQDAKDSHCVGSPGKLPEFVSRSLVALDMDVQGRRREGTPLLKSMKLIGQADQLGVIAYVS